MITDRKPKLGKPRNVRLKLDDCTAVDRLVESSGGAENDSDVLRRIVSLGLQALAEQRGMFGDDDEARNNSSPRDRDALRRIEKLLLEMRAENRGTREEVARMIGSALKLDARPEQNTGSPWRHDPGESQTVGITSTPASSSSLSRREASSGAADVSVAVVPNVNRNDDVDRMKLPSADAQKKLTGAESQIAQLPFSDIPGAIPESMFDPNIDYDYVEGDDDVTPPKDQKPSDENILDL